MKIPDKISSFFNDSYINNTQNYQILHMIIYLFLISYVVSIQPKLPKFIETLFKNTLFRLICISYILWRANDNILLSTLLTITFLFIMHYTNSNYISSLMEPVKKKLYNGTNKILNSVEPIKQKMYTATHDIVNLVEPYSDKPKKSYTPINASSSFFNKNLTHSSTNSNNMLVSKLLAK